jgi:hypothetical protein
MVRSWCDYWVRVGVGREGRGGVGAEGQRLVPIDTLELGPDDEPIKPAWHQKIWKGATHGLNVDIHKVVKSDAKVHAIHERAEVFEPRVEYAFSYLQAKLQNRGELTH